MLNAQIQQSIMMVTGMLPDGTPAGPPAGSESGNVTSAEDAGQNGMLPGMQVGGPETDTLNKLLQRAYGARFAQRRVPDEE
jgi:hypothetical protein